MVYVSSYMGQDSNFSEAFDNTLRLTASASLKNWCSIIHYNIEFINSLHRVFFLKFDRLFKF